MKSIALSMADNSNFDHMFGRCSEWAGAHKAEVGAIEMAVGAAILSWGVMSGHINMGAGVVGSSLGDIGAMAGLGLGGVGSAVVAATFLKGLFVGGVVGVAGVTAVPAMVLIGGGALIAGAFGYVVGDKLQAILNPPAGWGDLLEGGSIVLVGLALMLDGARRIIRDERVLSAFSRFKDGVVELIDKGTEIIAKTIGELQEIVKDMASEPTAWGISGAGAAAGVAVGSSIAAGTVTVAGSSALGAVALSLGLVSAPVWPVIAGGAAGLALGIAAWKGVQRFRGGKR